MALSKGALTRIAFLASLAGVSPKDQVLRVWQAGTLFAERCLRDLCDPQVTSARVLAIPPGVKDKPRMRAVAARSLTPAEITVGGVYAG